MNRDNHETLCPSIVKVLFIVLLLFSSSSVAEEELEDETLQLVREVSSHEYEPPADGKITQSQVDKFIRIAEQAASLEEKYNGFANATLLATIEAVAVEDGNWAEYQWVHTQLKQTVVTRTMASLEQDEASRHNGTLLTANEDRLRTVLRLQ